MNAGYLNFLKDSLQIENFIRPEGVTFAPPESPVSLSLFPDLAFWIPEAMGALSKEAHDLLRKMTKAMGYELDQVPLSLNAHPPEAARAIVIFITETHAQLGQWSADGITMTTYSPEALVKEPALKKASWGHLQAVMAALKT